MFVCLPLWTQNVMSLLKRRQKASCHGNCGVAPLRRRAGSFVRCVVISPIGLPQVCAALQKCPPPAERCLFFQNNQIRIYQGACRIVEEHSKTMGVYSHRNCFCYGTADGNLLEGYRRCVPMRFTTLTSSSIIIIIGVVPSCAIL